MSWPLFIPPSKELELHAWKERRREEEKGHHCTGRELLAFLALLTSCQVISCRARRKSIPSNNSRRQARQVAVVFEQSPHSTSKHASKPSIKSASASHHQISTPTQLEQIRPDRRFPSHGLLTAKQTAPPNQEKAKRPTYLRVQYIAKQSRAHLLLTTSLTTPALA